MSNHIIDREEAEYPSNYVEEFEEGVFTLRYAEGSDTRIVVTNSWKGVRGWVLTFLGSDPESSTSFYRVADYGEWVEPLDPTLKNPTEQTGARFAQGPREVTQAVRDYLDRHDMRLVEDDALARTMEEQRNG